MPPAYVKAYVKRNKNDAADAEAICEAVTRPSMRFVPVKDADQQSVLMLHRARKLLVRQRTMLVNALCAPTWRSSASSRRKGIQRAELVALHGRREDGQCPGIAREVLATMVVQIEQSYRRVSSRWIKRIVAWCRDPMMRHAGWQPFPALARSPPRRWPPRSRTRRCFDPAASLAAWLGLVPRQHSTGGKGEAGPDQPKWATPISAQAADRRA